MNASGCGWKSLLIALAVAPGAGCTPLRPAETQLRPIGSKAPTYDSAAINYRLPPPAPARNAGDVQPASYAPQAPAASRTQYLSIAYPHPAGRKGLALAEVIVARDPSAVAANRSDGWLGGVRRATRDRLPGLAYADGIESAWALDLPIAEVDLLIQRLDEQGYFSDSKRPATGAELSARINGLGFSKPWQSVPELSALVGRVRRQGKLVSHREPLDTLAACPSAAEQSPVKTALYTVPAEAPAPGIIERLPPVE